MLKFSVSSVKYLYETYCETLTFNLRNAWLDFKEVSIRYENEELSVTFEFVWNLCST